jgi:enamine deaminase RidA (YjgF/YER057c/UK114 family)
VSPEEQLARLEIELPSAPKPMGVYSPIVVVGDMAYLSGHGPLNSDNSLTIGRVGDDLSLEEGYQAARQTGLAMLATLRAHLGTLDRVERVVKITGMVHATPEFTQHPAVINGCSELLAEVFGPLGVAARSAVGMNSLPAGMAVEIEGIFQVREA